MKVVFAVVAAAALASAQVFPQGYGQFPPAPAFAPRMSHYNGMPLVAETWEGQNENYQRDVEQRVYRFKNARKNKFSPAQHDIESEVKSQTVQETSGAEQETLPSQTEEVASPTEKVTATATATADAAQIRQEVDELEKKIINDPTIRTYVKEKLIASIEKAYYEKYYHSKSQVKYEREGESYSSSSEESKVTIGDSPASDSVQETSVEVESETVPASQSNKALKKKCRHKVKKGDNQWDIRMKYAMSTEDIEALNPSVNWDNLQIGQRVLVEKPSCPQGTFVYRIKKGDTMYKIAQRNQVTLQSLIDANPSVEDPELIYPGWPLCVPKN